MSRHEFHSIEECPAQIAWLNGEGGYYCDLISGWALIRKYQWQYGAALRNNNVYVGQGKHRI